jgi:hypothetical protein
MEFQSPRTGPDGPPYGLAGALNGCLDEATQRWLDDGPPWDDDAAWGEPGDEWPDDEFGDECSGDEFEFDLGASFAEDHHPPTPAPVPVSVSDRVEWALVAAEAAIVKRPEFCAASMRVAALG